MKSSGPATADAREPSSRDRAWTRIPSGTLSTSGRPPASAHWRSWRPFRGPGGSRRWISPHTSSPLGHTCRRDDNSSRCGLCLPEGGGGGNCQITDALSKSPCYTLSMLQHSHSVTHSMRITTHPQTATPFSLNHPREPITFVHAAAESTGLSDASVDLVSICLVCHELPQSATEAVVMILIDGLPGTTYATSACVCLPPLNHC